MGTLTLYKHNMLNKRDHEGQHQTITIDQS